MGTYIITEQNSYYIVVRLLILPNYVDNLRYTVGGKDFHSN